MTIVLALIALLGSVSSTAAQSAIPPVCSVGDTWKFSDGRVTTVTKIEDGWTSVTGSLRDCLACVVRLDKDFNFDGTVQDASGNAVDVMKMRFVLVGLAWKFWDWPLEVGKQWRFTARSYFNQVSRKNDVASTVKAFEEVKTKAGTFKAFKIQRDWSELGPASGRYYTWIDTIWYAPDAKTIVKFSSTNRLLTEWELESLSLK